MFWFAVSVRRPGVFDHTPFEALLPVVNFEAHAPDRDRAGALAVCDPVKPVTTIVFPLDSVTLGRSVSVIVLFAP